MPYEIRVKDVPELLVAATTRQASLDTIGKEIKEAFVELMGAVAPVGYGRGMPGAICHELPDQISDGTWEIFMPVAAPFDAPQGVEVKRLPAIRVAYTLHVGRYEGCALALEAVAAWVADHGRQVVGPCRELYVNDPGESGEDHAITEVQVPVE